jgi:hypothetical protein
MYNLRFTVPLDRQEVAHIAKSVARYTFKNFSPAGFSAWQAAQGRKGGLKSKRKPLPDSEQTLEPWSALGIARATYYRKKKAGEL